MARPFCFQTLVSFHDPSFPGASASSSRPSVLQGFLCHINLDLPLLQAPTIYPATGRFAWSSYTTAAVPPRSLTDMSLEQCRDGAAGKPPAEGSKLLPGPTIFLGPFLPLSVVPHSQTLLASSVLSCSLGDFLLIRHHLCLYWSWFPLFLQTGVCHFSAGLRLFKPGIHLFFTGLS
jgi:hypothetical protein